VDTVRDALSLDSEKWFHRLLISSGLVAVGCIFEIWESTVDIVRWTRLKFRLTAREENPTSWYVPIATVGLVFVIVGVIGEGFFEAKVSRLETAIRAHDESLVEDAVAKAGIANGKATEAGERTLILEKERAALEKKAEDERLARIELEAQVSPRRLTGTQQKQIANSLSSFAGKTIGVATYSQDAEAMILATQIEEALAKAKIVVHDRIGTFGAVGFPLYLGVTVDKASSDKTLESSLFKALSTKGRLETADTAVAFGQGSTMYMPPGSTREDAFVLVGEKPIAKPVHQSEEK